MTLLVCWTSVSALAGDQDDALLDLRPVTLSVHDGAAVFERPDGRMATVREGHAIGFSKATLLRVRRDEAVVELSDPGAIGRTMRAVLPRQGADRGVRTIRKHLPRDSARGSPVVRSKLLRPAPVQSDARH